MVFEYMSVLSQNMRLDHCRFLRDKKIGSLQIDEYRTCYDTPLRLICS